MGIHGFSIVELMMAALIMGVVCGGGFVVFSAAQATWFTTDVNIQLQENLRKSLDRLTMELRQSKITKIQVLDSAGPNNTDVAQFSVPVICHAGDNLLDASGDVAHWGAPLTWGCSSSTCMDANDNCATVDYSLIKYGLNDSNRLVRWILDPASSVVRTDIVANDITNFQITTSGNVVSLVVTGQQKSGTSRILSAQATADVYLRN